MRDVLKRLERLESSAPSSSRPLRIVHQIIKSDNGRAIPFDPTWAEGRAARLGLGEGQRIEREPNEAADAFERRADATFAGCGYFIG